MVVVVVVGGYGGELVVLVVGDGVSGFVAAVGEKGDGGFCPGFVARCVAVAFAVDGGDAEVVVFVGAGGDGAGKGVFAVGDGADVVGAVAEGGAGAEPRAGCLDVAQGIGVAAVAALYLYLWAVGVDGAGFGEVEGEGGGLSQCGMAHDDARGPFGGGHRQRGRGGVGHLGLHVGCPYFRLHSVISIHPSINACY